MTLPSPLAEQDGLVVDCQATMAAPRGHLLELGWARLAAGATVTRSRLVSLPPGVRLPPAVARITGLTEPLLRDAVDPRQAWRELAHAAAQLADQPAPTIIHFARFERPFLAALAGEGQALEIVCTHEIARRLLPDLPRRSLRALAGYFGRAVGPLRRSADHVEATAFVWRELVRLLEAQGVTTWSALQAWLATPTTLARRSRRVWPMPRELRLGLPGAPGVYRLMRTSGDVLYVGKASSLHDRVNSYFRKQSGVDERMLEMLSQARAVACDTTATALEAALLEADEIKRHRPPYNIALTADTRRVWFASPDLRVHRCEPCTECPLGPFASAETLDRFHALVRGDRGALSRGRWGPDPACFEEGLGRLCAAHPEIVEREPAPAARLLRLGTRLWREGRRDRDVDDDPLTAEDRREWTPESVQLELEWLVIRTALACRRATWLTRLMDVSVAWREPGSTQARLLVVEQGEIVARAGVDDVSPSIPPGHARQAAARRAGITIASFDRVRVLTTELKRLVAAGVPVAVRFGPASTLADARLASALWWV